MAFSKQEIPRPVWTVNELKLYVKKEISNIDQVNFILKSEPNQLLISTVTSDQEKFSGLLTDLARIKNPYLTF